MPACTFCIHSPTADYALTVCSGDPEDIASWRRVVPAVFPRWHWVLVG